MFKLPHNCNAKECSNYHTITLISHTSKVMLKILQARLQQYVNQELRDVQAGFRKGRGTRDQIANICWIIEKECSRKISTSVSLTTLKPLTVWLTTNWKILRWQYQTTWPASWETCTQVRKQDLELDVEQWTGCKMGKEYVKAVYCRPVYLTSMESSVQFSSVTQSCPTLCNPMNHSTPVLPIHHQLSESTQTHVNWIGDAIQAFHSLSSPSPPALDLSQGLSKWVSSSHQVAKVLEFQLQHQSFQWTPRTDLL